MTQETHIESRFDRERSRHELARGIIGVGLLAIAFYGALALLRRKKVLFPHPLMAFVLLLLAVALLGACAKALRNRRID